MGNRSQQPATSNQQSSQSAYPLDEYHRRLLESLNHQLFQLKPPLKNSLPGILDLFVSLKSSEGDLADLLESHADHPAVAKLKRSLLKLAANLSTALNSHDATTRLDTLSHEHIQTICLGLSICAPAHGKRLFDASLDKDDRDTLQSLINTLLKQAMDEGLPDGVDANGQVFDILNMVSRYLKAGVIDASDKIKECFTRSLLLIEAWTAGDQCQQLISDHNLGRCAVQVATLINFKLLDLNDIIATTSSKEQPRTYGQLLQKCVLNLCSDAVLSRLTAAPVDAVSLLNVCNTVKDALDKRVLHPANPSLLPALDRLTRVIGTLPHDALAGPEADYITLANFSNFLRKIGEYRIKQKQVFKDALPAMEKACAWLAGFIETIDHRYVDGQTVSNLISFVKYCDKQIAGNSKAAAAPTSTSGSTTSSTAKGLLDQGALQTAASHLISVVLAKGLKCLDHPDSRGGAVAGLAYLWKRNLVPRTPELQTFMTGLLHEVAPVTGQDWPYDARVILPALKMMLDAGMVTEKDLWLSATAIDQQIRQIGANVEVVVALPPLPLPLPAPAITSTAPSKERTPPGATPIVKPTIAATFAPRSNASTYRAPVSDAWKNVEKGPKHLKPENSIKYRASEGNNQPSETNDHSKKNTEALDKKEIQTGKRNENPAESRHTEPTIISLYPGKQGASKKMEPTYNQKRADSNQSKKDKEKTKSQNKKTSDAKGKKTANTNRSLASDRSALFDAVNYGNSEQIEKLLNSGGRWTDERIIAALKELNDGIFLREKTFPSGFEKFVQGILQVRPENGSTLLSDYFAESPPQSVSVLHVLQKYSLIIDFHAFKTAVDVCNFATDANAQQWNQFIRTNKGKELLQLKDSYGGSVLFLAVAWNSSIAIDRLLKIPQGVMLALQRNNLGNYPLRYAIEKHQPETAIKLLTLPNANEQAAICNTDGQNALVSAARKSQVTVVQKLLSLPSAGSLITEIDCFGNNALFHAISAENIHIAQLLLRHSSANSQALVQNSKGWTPLLMATTMADNGFTEVIKRLLELPSAEEQSLLTHTDGRNALMIASQLGKAEVVRMLLELSTAEKQSLAVDNQGHNALLIGAIRSIGAVQRYEGVITTLLTSPSRRAQLEMAAKIADAGGAPYADFIDLIKEFRTWSEKHFPEHKTN